MSLETDALPGSPLVIESGSISAEGMLVRVINQTGPGGPEDHMTGWQTDLIIVPEAGSEGTVGFHSAGEPTDYVFADVSNFGLRSTISTTTAPGDSLLAFDINFPFSGGVPVPTAPGANLLDLAFVASVGADGPFGVYAKQGPNSVWSDSSDPIIQEHVFSNVGEGSGMVQIGELFVSLNDAPALTPLAPSLSTITEDDTSNSGNLVSSIVGASITDPDPGAVEGIAISGLTSGNGTWEYSTDGGSNWFAIGTVSDSSALLVRDSDRIRFVPDAQNADSATATYRAWDQTSGSAGTKVDVSTNGGTTAFSTATDTASITVTAVNDAPQLDNTGDMRLTDVSENETDPAGDTVAAILASAGGDRVTDVDSGAVEGLAIVGVDNTNGTWQYSTNGGTSWAGFVAVGNTSAVLLDTTARVRFVPDGDHNGSAGNITFRAWDQTSGNHGDTGVDVSTNGGTTAYSSATETATLNVNSENDAPVLGPIAPSLSTITEDDTSNSGNLVSSIVGASITDPDPGAVEGIAISGLTSGNGTWEYSTDGGSSWFAIGTVSDSSALLVRDSDRIRFVPDAQNADSATATYRAWDQTSGSAGTKVDVSTNGGTTAFSTATDTASITVTAVNDAPQLDNTGDMRLTDVSENETDPAGDTVAAILASAGGDRVTDVDSGAVEGLAVIGVDNTNGTWQYSTNGGTSWNGFVAVGNTSAVLLDTTARVRFVPNADYNGSAGNITFRAWDQTSGNHGDTGVDVSTNGGATAYSSAIETASLTVREGQPEAIQIIDNGEAGFSRHGNWTQGSQQGFRSDIEYSAAGTGSDVARWTFSVPPGTYRVSATWPPHANRATDAPFQVMDEGTVLATLHVNQETAPNDFSDRGASWEDLGGAYTISGDTLVVELSDDANEFVIADAVRIERIGGPEIAVFDGTREIRDGGVVDFGTTFSDVPVDKVLTIRNAGAENLTLAPFDAGALPPGYRLVSGFDTTLLPPGATTSLTLRLQSNVDGNFMGPTSIGNSDSDENPFDLSLTGTVSDVRIIDNREAGFSRHGIWTLGTAQGFRGDNDYSAAGTGNDITRWIFSVVPGTYRISATWPPHPNRATDAPFKVWDNTGVLATVDVNQELAPNDFSDRGASWEDLGGPYTISGDDLAVELSDDANEFVIADAVRIERISGPEISVSDGATEINDGGVVDFGTTFGDIPVDKVLTIRNVGTENLTLSPFDPAALPAGYSLVSDFDSTLLPPNGTTSLTLRLQSNVDGSFMGPTSFGNSDTDENPFDLFLTGTVSDVQIIDNREAGFSRHGNWTLGNAQGFRGDNDYSAAGTGNDITRWTFSVIPGTYRVSATWPPHSNRATDSPFTVRDEATVLATVDVNQEVPPNDFSDGGATWEDLGGSYTISGDTLVVELSDDANEYVIADAVRIERMSGPEIAVFDGTTEISDGGVVDFGTTFGEVPVDRLLTIRNVGDESLTLSPFDPAGLPPGYSLVSDFDATLLPPGATASLILRLHSIVGGTFMGPTSFGNNDGDENPFDLFLTGAVSDVRIIDNGEAGFSRQGNWTSGSSQGFRSDVDYSAAGTGNDVARWTFSVKPGTYRVSATWPPHPNRATDAPFMVRDEATVLAALDVNQELAPNDFSDRGASWEDLGGLYMISGDRLVVELSDDANEFVIADAVRIERIPGPETVELHGTTDRDDEGLRAKVSDNVFASGDHDWLVEFPGMRSTT